MKRIEWDIDKNIELQLERNLSFEAIVIAIELRKLIEIVPHPSSQYPHQQIMVVEIENYLVLVPFVEDEEKIFFKTAFRSRKANKKHQRRQKHEKV